MKHPGFLFSIFIIILFFLLFTPVSVAYTIKPVDLGSPEFSYGCHPSYDDFLISTIVANLTSDRTQGDVPFRVKFYDTSYGDYNNRIWDFGDGNTSTERNPVHIFRQPGNYDVSLTVFNNYSYETSMADYQNNSRGELTDMMWQSVDRHLDYITAYERGTGVRQEVSEGWYPEEQKALKLPSGAEGAVGSASFTGSEITLYNSSNGFLTEMGYQDSLEIAGIYNLVKSVPYNSGF